MIIIRICLGVNEISKYLPKRKRRIIKIFDSKYSLLIIVFELFPKVTFQFPNFFIKKVINVPNIDGQFLITVTSPQIFCLGPVHNNVLPYWSRVWGVTRSYIHDLEGFVLVWNDVKHFQFSIFIFLWNIKVDREGLNVFWTWNEENPKLETWLCL